MPVLNLQEDTHRRLNILTGEWILVSPHRMKRPWQGITEETAKNEKPKYDPDCYLCPGNSRAGGIKNPHYKETFVFDNDFSALISGSPSLKLNNKNLLMAKGEKGICRVVCFSPRHDLTLADLSEDEIKKVIDVWSDEYETLGKKDFINYVQIFENKGEMMGCSNPHPHGQIWAQQSVPVEPAKETLQQKNYLRKNKSCLLCDYLKAELKGKERIVYQNQGFAAFVPFWATWPFEILIISKRHRENILEFSEKEKSSFAEILRIITGTYDRVFSQRDGDPNVSFPYSAGIHQSPTDGKDHDEWHFHFHFYPPLLRSAKIKKFMVGYEMLAEPQRDFTPELSAEKLREVIFI